ncbi:Zds-C domain-containing protein [Mycena sanguinolenta]|uniref:Zds-C domain-containing protein n=1 Tax=Mycena sanguinolenta TaxID=230812 RepID=A0A8H6Z502_9AGAR|nr:Zds-C domain-containing protein [Mycena sanguinolenta]
MEPTEYDIRREVEALKDLRRRSTAPGALALDPDLPNQGPPSPTSPYREPGTSARPSPDPAPSSQPNDDPFHLFWVPASLHPEIAPAEFRAFLKEHARNPPSDDEQANLRRTPSASSNVSSGLGRKKSMLSRQYEPSEKDEAADDTVVPLRRNRSIFSSNQNQGPQLTISDLQKLEELAEEALSLNVSPLALDDDTDLGDEADQPIVGAGKFLRRTPRTRIRKPNLPGDGGGHRFGERRRGASGRSVTSAILQRTSSDVSSSDHGDSIESVSVTPRARTTLSDEGPPPDRPDSFSEEALIYDAYARDDEDSSSGHDLPPTLPPVLITSSPPLTLTDFADIPPPQAESPPPQNVPPVPEPAPVPSTVIHQPQPTRVLSPPPSEPPQQQQGLLAPDSYQAQPPAPPSRTPSPSDFDHTPSPSTTPTNSPPASTFVSPPRKEKDKKGLFGKWGSDKEKEKSSKASKKERERLEKEKEKERGEKESGFFGSLFGSKKKNEAPAETTSLHGGREAAHALLGQSQRAPKSPGPPQPMVGVPGVMGPGGVDNYSRYPIHVERAIYRLSHIKLANPRRPLYEQVLISNLMFWYLGVINKAQAAAQAEQQAQAAAQATAQAQANMQPEEERLERERAEREAAAAQERTEKERMEREAAEREQRERAEREMMEKKKRDASPRRGGAHQGRPAWLRAAAAEGRDARQGPAVRDAAPCHGEGVRGVQRQRRHAAVADIAQVQPPATAAGPGALLLFARRVNAAAAATATTRRDGACGPVDMAGGSGAGWALARERVAAANGERAAAAVTVAAPAGEHEASAVDAGVQPRRRAGRRPAWGPVTVGHRGVAVAAADERQDPQGAERVRGDCEWPAAAEDRRGAACGQRRRGGGGHAVGDVAAAAAAMRWCRLCLSVCVLSFLFSFLSPLSLVTHHLDFSCIPPANRSLCSLTHYATLPAAVLAATVVIVTRPDTAYYQYSSSTNLASPPRHVVHLLYGILMHHSLRIRTDTTYHLYEYINT